MYASTGDRPTFTQPILLFAVTAAITCALALPTTAQRGPRPKRVVTGANPPAAVTGGLVTHDLATGAETPESLVQALVGPGAIVTNVHYTGAPIAAGTFSGGTDAIGLDSGVILSSGDVALVVGPVNTSPGDEPTANGLPGDPDLDAILGSTYCCSFDAAVLEFDLECPTGNAASFQYAFASEEYEHPPQSINDLFACFVNGQNVALLPGTIAPVTLHSVNGSSNSGFYRTNDCGTLGVGFPCSHLPTEMDGMTVVLSATAALLPGPNHVKLVIADGGDDVVDSDVFLRGSSFVCSPGGPVFETPSDCEPILEGWTETPFDLDVRAWATNGLPGASITLDVSGDPIPLGAGTFLPPMPTSPGQPGSTHFQWTPNPADVGLYHLVFTATDDLQQSASMDVALQISAPGAPAFESPSPCDQTLELAAGLPFTFDVRASAWTALVCGGPGGIPGEAVTLTVSGDSPPLAGGTFVPPLPAGPVQPVSTQFLWTPTLADVGTWHLEFTATDALQHTASCGVTLHVRAGPCGSSGGQVTRRVSVSTGGTQADGMSWPSAISADGRWVVFQSDATNLVPGDSNAAPDIFLHDRLTGATELVDVDSNGVHANAGSSLLDGETPISADGRFVVFYSVATNLVPGDVNGAQDAFLRDRQNGTTELVSVATNGAQGNDSSQACSVSSDGRFVAFLSRATNLTPAGSGGYSQVYVRDRTLAVTECVSVDPSGLPGDGDIYGASLSSDGRYVAFHGLATSLVAGDTNGKQDVFLRDRQNAATELVSVHTFGFQATDDSYHGRVSADGRFIVFFSLAMNLTNGDAWPPTDFDVFLRDRQNGTTQCVSLTPAGLTGNSHSSFPSISEDGRYVAFETSATDFLPLNTDTNGVPDVYLWDRLTNTKVRVSVSSGGAQSNGQSSRPSLSAGGQVVAFTSSGNHLVPSDTNGTADIFVRQWQDGTARTAFTRWCTPGTGAVIACPCSNPPVGPERGCDNSGATGGASLCASGNTDLSADGLVFTVYGEQPNALSILVQGNTPASSGIVYGQGVRCLAGTIRRLYTGFAQGGTIVLPNLPAGGTPVSVRSARTGDVILPGQSRWYFVFYRDPVVLGGCPAVATFNATDTGEISWSL